MCKPRLRIERATMPRLLYACHAGHTYHLLRCVDQQPLPKPRSKPKPADNNLRLIKTYRSLRSAFTYLRISGCILMCMSIGRSSSDNQLTTPVTSTSMYSHSIQCIPHSSHLIPPFFPSRYVPIICQSVHTHTHTHTDAHTLTHDTLILCFPRTFPILT